MKTTTYHTVVLSKSGKFANFSQGWTALKILSVAAGTGMIFSQNIAQAANVKFTRLIDATPLYGADVGRYSKPAMVDIDDDGDFDIFFGNNAGRIIFFENTGTDINPIFVRQTDTANPLNLVNVGTDSTPTFVDIDDDGDFDVFIGEDGGNINFYLNEGSRSNPVFTEKNGPGVNPLDGIDVGFDSAPTFVDIDDDNDFDVFIGEKNGNVTFYENTGSSLEATFVNRTADANPLNGEDVGSNSVPYFVDIDNDLDFDVFIGNNTGRGDPVYYENTGTRVNPVFTLQPTLSNPMKDSSLGTYSALVFADIDNDGDLDCIAGTREGTVTSYKNTGSKNHPVMSLWVDPANPLSNVREMPGPAPVFADMDDDGDLDLFVGKGDGTIAYYKNIGNQLVPEYAKQNASTNPMYGVNVSYWANLALADLDNDGDTDLLTSENEGRLKYYKNIGSAQEPIFAAQSGDDNPLSDYDNRDFANPVFTDIDGDGDFDLCVGTTDGTYPDSEGLIRYFENTGNERNPVFTERTGGENPLDSVRVITAAFPSFADIDGDGDLDLVAGEVSGANLHYYENKGSKTRPLFQKLTGTDNPLTREQNSIPMYHPTFADLDNDGDLDLFVGEFGYGIYYFRNEGKGFPWTMYIPIFTRNR